MVFTGGKMKNKWKVNTMSVFNLISSGKWKVESCNQQTQFA